MVKNKKKASGEIKRDFPEQKKEDGDILDPTAENIVIFIKKPQVQVRKTKP